MSTKHTYTVLKTKLQESLDDKKDGMSTKHTYTVLKTKLQESLDRQNYLQPMIIDITMKKSLEIKKLIDALESSVNDEPLVYSNS